MKRPYILEETNWKEVKNTTYELAILPWGATEAHNYHMPYGTDNYQVTHVVEAAAKNAWSAGSKVLVLPGIHYGIQTGQMDIPFCMNILPSTQLILIKDIADTLVKAGCPKLIIVNGHGANHFKNIIRELSFFFPSLFCCAVNWYDAVPAKQYFEKPADHADEFETSCIMHIRPELLLPLSEAGDGKTLKFKTEALKSGWATAQREWTKITNDTGSGNPELATEEKGKKFLDACVARLSNFIIELSKLNNNEMYE